ncbi:MAG: HAD family hydrolase [Firmicutes bacterium]|nr:HAD family hydrolase [Bacillota bacterium]
MKVIVFDIGGTLMEYRNMPHVWIDYYQTAFERVREQLLPSLSDDEIAAAIEVLRSYNPKVKYREVDYTSEVIFGDACASWSCPYDLQQVIAAFYSAMELVPYTFPDSIPALEALRARGLKIAALTDVATGMPDELHKSYFPDLMPYFDLYVSSVSCGWRKPNPKGLQDIADHFGASPEEMLMIGDEEKDVVVAQRFGCPSVHIERKGREAAWGQTYTITTLEELLPLL